MLDAKDTIFGGYERFCHTERKFYVNVMITNGRHWYGIARQNKSIADLAIKMTTDRERIAREGTRVAYRINIRRK